MNIAIEEICPHCNRKTGKYAVGDYKTFKNLLHINHIQVHDKGIQMNG